MDVLINPHQCSDSLDAILTTTYADNYITKGNAFMIEKNISMASGETLYILYDYSTYKPNPDQSGAVFVYPAVYAATSGPVFVKVYRETGYTGGTPFNAINPNTLVTKKTSGTTFSTGASGTNKGELTLEYLVGGGSGGVGNSVPGVTTGLSFFVRSNTKKTLVEIINASGTSITLHSGQVIYEI